MDEKLVALLDRGGVFYDVPGDTVKDLLDNITGMVDLPQKLDRKILLKAMLEREELMSTGIGKGIALPHPRNPLVEKPEDQFISICFPQAVIDWNALDGKPVYAVILIVSASPKLHLHTLSRISFLCQQESFLQLLREHSSKETIIQAIREAEAAWN